MTKPVELLSVVALTEDVPDQALSRGQVGTVVEVYSPEVVEVEFSDDKGRTDAMGALKVDPLMVLHHHPVPASGKTAFVGGHESIIAASWNAS